MRETNFEYEAADSFNLTAVISPRGTMVFSNLFSEVGLVRESYDTAGITRGENLELQPTTAREMPMIFDLAPGQLLGYERSVEQSRLHLTEHPNSLPASYWCPGQHRSVVLRVSFTSARSVRFR